MYESHSPCGPSPENVENMDYALLSECTADVTSHLQLLHVPLDDEEVKNEMHLLLARAGICPFAQIWSLFKIFKYLFVIVIKIS